MPTPVIENGAFKKITASVVVRTGPAQLVGLFVSSASATPTVEVYGAATSGTATCVPQFTPIAGTWYPMPFSTDVGLTVGIGGTVTGSLSWQPSPAGTSN